MQVRDRYGDYGRGRYMHKLYACALYATSYDGGALATEMKINNKPCKRSGTKKTRTCPSESSPTPQDLLG